MTKPMQTSETDTLRFQLNQRPNMVQRDIGDVTCLAVAKAMTFRIGNSIAEKLVSPERRAIEFYLYNHAIGLLEKKFSKDEPLPIEVLEFINDYHDFLNLATVEAVYYLILICTRESRHAKGFAQKGGQVYAKYGHEVKNFHQSLLSCNSGSAQMRFRETPPDCTLACWTGFMEECFFTKGCWSTSMGGPRWGDIAKQLHKWVSGKISSVGLLDVIWALCHNGGPIFNKGMIYSNYNLEKLRTILDVQRAGFIPEFVRYLQNEDHKFLKESHSIVKIWETAKKILGSEWEGNGFVDWFKVEASGTKKYPEAKALQVKIYGQPTWVGGQEKEGLLAGLKTAAEEDLLEIQEMMAVNLLTPKKAVGLTQVKF